MDSQEKQDVLQHLGKMRRIGGDVIYYGPQVNLDEFERLVRSVYEGDSLEIIENLSDFQDSDWQEVLSNVASKPSGILIKSDGKPLPRALRRGVVELARAKDRQQWRVARKNDPELSVIFAARTDTLTRWDEYLKQFFVWYPLT